MPFQPALVWFLVGLALAFLELMAPGVILIFFAAGAWIVALTTWIDLTPTLPWQMLAFAAASLALLVLLRRHVRGRFLGHSSGNQDLNIDLDDFVGHTVVVVEDIHPGAQGLAEFKGANWSARSNTRLARGDRAVIQAVDGITLVVTAVISSPTESQEASE